MLRLLVIVLLICSFAVDQTEADLSSVLKDLSSKALAALKNVKIPVLNAHVETIRSHIRNILSFFKGREGDIPITDTEFVLHFVADRCHLIGKRFLIVDFEKCKATVTEKLTGLSATCMKKTQEDSIECASYKLVKMLLNLVKLVREKTFD